MIRERVKALKTPRYKIVVLVTIGQLNGQNMQICSRCLWDATNDTFASYSFKNSSLFGVASVYAVYFEWFMDTNTLMKRNQTWLMHFLFIFASYTVIKQELWKKRLWCLLFLLERSHVSCDDSRIKPRMQTDRRSFENKKVIYLQKKCQSLRVPGEGIINWRIIS